MSDVSICEWCKEEVAAHERAPTAPAVLHRECILRMIAGSAAHILGDCACCGGSRHDPPNMSKRDAARLAVETWRVQNNLKR